MEAAPPLVLLDCDGTLYHDVATLDGLRTAVQEASDLPPHVSERLYAQYGSTLAGMLAENLLDNEDATAFLVRAHLPDIVPAPAPAPADLRTAVQDLCSAVHVVVVSAAPEAHVRRCLRSLGLDGCLSLTVTTEDLGHQPKAEPDTWRHAHVKAMELTGAGRDSPVWVFDDHPDNVAAALRCGYDAHVVTPARRLPAALRATALASRLSPRTTSEPTTPFGAM